MVRNHSIAELKSATSGRWLDVLCSAGLSADILDGKGHPCPKCGGRDRFAALPDINQRGAVFCRRCFAAGTDPAPGDGLATLQWLLGCNCLEACEWLAKWLGLEPGKPAKPKIGRTIRISANVPVDPHYGKMAERCHRVLRLLGCMDSIAEQLALPVDALDRLRVGWSDSDRAITWPMVDDAGQVIGIRLRAMDTGQKWSARGGKNGLFIPDGITEAPARLFICEGPTDTAALLSVGLVAIGRPSCNGAVKMTANYVRRLHPSEVVIVADDDEHNAGINGARALAETLVSVCPAVCVILPPSGINDARDWVASGVTGDDIHHTADGAIVLRLTIVSGVTQ